MPQGSGKSVYTITGHNFMDALAQGLLRRFGSEPAQFAAIRVFLPTRRACQALTDAFLRESSGTASLLPTMTPIGDVDDDELALLDSEQGDLGDAAGLPPSLPQLERSLLLARLVMKANPALSPAHAVSLSGELSRLLNEVQTERLEFSDLARIVPDRFAEHWQETLSFLQIVTEHWPQILAEIGCLDPAERRNNLIAALTRSLENRRTSGPVIAAGSTGSMPATRDLLVCIAALDQGAVILPGLDRTLDADSLEALEDSHPQYGMIRLLDHLKVAPEDVADWEPAIGSARHDLVNQALRPPGTAANLSLPDDAAVLLAGVSRIQCALPQQEAQVIALLLREALETPDRTAALVTPDRRLARRVASELRRWKVEVDDSGGTPLGHTIPGVFLRLTAEAFASRAAAFPLLAALKHPLAAGGCRPVEFRQRVKKLERRVLRGRTPTPGLDGLVKDTEQLYPDDRTLINWIRHLEAISGPFADLICQQAVPVSDLLQAHIDFAEALAATDTEEGRQRLWAKTAGETAAEFVNDLRQSGDRLEPIAGSEWPALLESLMAGQVVRPAYGLHPRLHVWGLQEARLQGTDVMVLGGLNEGTWPPGAVGDPWLSRPMRAAFGLPPPERRLGQTAHDFVQGFSASRVYLTRSTRVDGSPSVPARWLSRLETLLSTDASGQQILAAWQDDEARLLRWQAQLDHDQHGEHGFRTASPVAPQACPPVHARPSRLSVTSVETLIRDPYATYARHVLGLSALDPVDPPPGPADRGTLIHEAIDRFLSSSDADGNSLERFLAVGLDVFADHMDRPEVRAFWWPRFERIAAWIITTDKNLRSRRAHCFTEVSGEMTIHRPGTSFTLTAKADRIDVFRDGRIAVIDYKTGSLPRKTDVEAGLSPQLPLEAAMIRTGAFAEVPPGPIAELTYWHLTGMDEGGTARPACDMDPEELTDLAIDGLNRLISHYENPETPYRACPDRNIMPEYSDYDHLERIQEWAEAWDEP